jgi:RNA recognition motif-containing protein
MAYNIYLGNLPEWVTADDIRSWLHSSDLVCDEVRVIRDFETQQSKGYAFVEAPNEEEMEAIIRRFNRAPIDGKLLRAKAAHPKGDKAAQTRPAARKRKRRRMGPDGQPEGGKPVKPEPVGTFGEALQKAL